MTESISILNVYLPPVIHPSLVVFSRKANIVSGVHHSTEFGRNRSRPCRPVDEPAMNGDLYWKNNRLLPAAATDEIDGGTKKDVNSLAFDLSLPS